MLWTRSIFTLLRKFKAHVVRSAIITRRYIVSKLFVIVLVESHYFEMFWTLLAIFVTTHL